jgi:hypothetical protein
MRNVIIFCGGMCKRLSCVFVSFGAIDSRLARERDRDTVGKKISD